MGWTSALGPATEVEGAPGATVPQVVGTSKCVTGPMTEVEGAIAATVPTIAGTSSEDDDSSKTFIPYYEVRLSRRLVQCGWGNG